VTAAKVNLVPLPKEKAVLAIEFEQLLEALAATPVILKHKPSAIEVMDAFILNHARENPAMDRMRRAILQTDDPGALLNVELYADRAEDLPPRLEAIERDLAPFRCVHRRLMPLADQARVWGFREASLGLSMAMKGDEKSLSFVEDTAVKPEVLRDYIDDFLAMIRRNGSSSGVYAHASVGCLHVRPVVNMKTAEGVARFEAIATQSADLVLKYGGALSGEHGDGLVRGPFMEKMFGTALYQAFRTVKRTFDPHGVFNPGKIVDCPPLTEQPALRPRVQDTGSTDVLRLHRIWRLRPRGRNVQRRRGVPEEARRDDVSVVHGDAGRTGRDARPREHAAAGDDRPPRGIRVGRGRRARDARAVPRVSCVQG
jgi:FAD/FMN-containing dehydrogenase